MPKKRVSKRGADTIRVASVPNRAEVGQRSGALVVIQGAEVDLGRRVLCERPVTIGRGEDAELSLSDGSISRLHCRVERDDELGHYVLVDLGSTNGTQVNARRVEHRYPLSSGDKIFLGASVVRFQLVDRVDIQYESRLQEMVATDPLTGLASRRQYDASFAAMADRAGHDRSLLTVMVMDMDGLKQINDTHGHEMGGFAIVEVSSIIRDILENQPGTLARFGGDEFVGCFPDLPRERGIDLAVAVRDRVAAHNFVKDGVRIEPTMSIGVASYPADTDDPGQLFAVADAEMYRAKRGGKSRVSWPGDEA